MVEGGGEKKGMEGKVVGMVLGMEGKLGSEVAGSGGRVPFGKVVGMVGREGKDGIVGKVGNVGIGGKGGNVGFGKVVCRRWRAAMPMSIMLENEIAKKNAKMMHL